MKQGWEIKKLGEVCAFQRGLTYSKDDEVEHSNNCVLRSNNIDLDSMSIVLDELKYINDDFVVSEDKKVKPNTILICMSNGSKQHIGKVAFIDKEYGYAFGGFMGLIKPNTDVSPKFIYYSCISSSYKHFLAGIGNGANITNLKFSDLQQYTLPVPPREEQERIVVELDCLSGVIERKREQLKELDALAQSIFYQMFGDPITNEKGWEVKKLGEVCDIINGFAFKSQLFTDEGDCILRISNIQDGYVDLNDIAHFNKADYPEVKFEKYAVLPNDIVIALSGATTGKLGINRTGHTLYLNQRVAICREKSKEILRDYLLYYLHEQSQKFLSDAAGVAQPNLSTEQMKDYDMSIPSITTQQEFADKIEAIEKQKELIKKSISEVEDLFNSRMSYYFN